MSLTFSSRIGKKPDIVRIIELCKRAVGPSDYVIPILENVIRDQGLFLAFFGDEEEQLVGISNFTPTIDRAAWLSMARVDPAWRGKGVAQFLQKSMAKHARKNDLKTLRLWINSTNRPSIRSVLKGGFHPVSHYAHFVWNVKRPKKQFVELPIRADYSSEIERKILSSEMISKGNGYFAHKWHFVRARKEVIKAIFARNELVQHENSIFVLTSPEKEDERRHMEFSLLSGPLAPSLRYLQTFAARMSLVSLGTFLPYTRYIVHAAESVGFSRDSWATHSIVFERRA